MIRVLVAEDEPASMRHLCNIIEQYCIEDFVVVKKCENGKEALEEIDNYFPDLVITDIKMPIMNGIELIKVIKQVYPDIFCIIISGYQDFQFAQEAVRQNALNYLLKPLSPKTVKNALEEIKEKINCNIYLHKTEIIHMFLQEKPVNVNEVKRYFPSDEYYIAVKRKNGLMRRFSRNFYISNPMHNNYDFCYFGRDQNEYIYIYPKANGIDSFKRYTEASRFDEQEVDEFSTTVIYTQLIKNVELECAINKLIRMLDRKMLFEKDAVFKVNSFSDDCYCDCSDLYDVNIIKEIEYNTQKGNYKFIKKILKEQLCMWEKENAPQLSVECWLKQIISAILCSSSIDFPKDEFEFEVEEAFFRSVSYKELYANVCTIIDAIYESDKNKAVRVDTPEFFSQIEKYIKGNLSSNLTLKSICEKFNISQTYLSKLFRKHTTYSCNEYLTATRIENAKMLMDGNPSILIKDVAALCGFSDQFYFSKLFKSITGQSPTEYIAKHNIT